MSFAAMNIPLRPKTSLLHSNTAGYMEAVLGQMAAVIERFIAVMIEKDLFLVIFSTCKSRRQQEYLERNNIGVEQSSGAGPAVYSVLQGKKLSASDEAAHCYDGKF